MRERTAAAVVGDAPASAALAVLDAEGFITLPTRVHSLVCAIVEGRREAGSGYADRSFFLDDEDAPGARRLATRGGFWNATDAGRAAEGLTLSDATALRRALLAIGVRVDHDDADALLCAGERGVLRTLWEAQGRTGRDPDQPETREAILERKREAIAARRERARALGLCIVCCKVATNPGNTTCAGCQASANVRMVARRTKARKQKADAHMRAARKAAKALENA
ncbi:MAG: hypothetical protein JWO85_2649 [Candidatus Eremiobacteraeota bacterium]|nr:hypothetical protein [Candidatus Eremiobacteraeota bacterium]